MASLCLICGTSLERIEPESLTRSLSEFVHGYISVQKSVGTLDLVQPSREAALRSIKLVNFISPASPSWSIPGNCGFGIIDREHYCVFAVALPGCAMETNWMASMTPTPMGVGTETR